MAKRHAWKPPKWTGASWRVELVMSLGLGGAEGAASQLSRGGLTGAVSGSFNGVPFGEGRVVNDAAGPRACFIVPMTGDELCTAL